MMSATRAPRATHYSDNGEIFLAERILAEHGCEIVCRKADCVLNGAPAACLEHRPSRRQRRSQRSCRSGYHGQGVSGYLELASEQLPPATTAALARTVLQEHHNDQTAVCTLDAIAHRFESGLLVPAFGSQPCIPGTLRSGTCRTASASAAMDKARLLDFDPDAGPATPTHNVTQVPELEPALNASEQVTIATSSSVTDRSNGPISAPFLLHTLDSTTHIHPTMPTQRGPRARALTRSVLQNNIDDQTAVHTLDAIACRFESIGQPASELHFQIYEHLSAIRLALPPISSPSRYSIHWSYAFLALFARVLKFYVHHELSPAQRCPLIQPASYPPQLS
jgi:hypothetical protein